MAARQRPTIRDIAERVGVSPTTVSYALRGVGVISEETRRRVMQAAQDIGYPIAAEQRRSLTIGVLFPAAFEGGLLYRHDIFGANAQGIDDAVQALGGCTVTYVPNDPDGFPFQHLYWHGVDGVINIGSDSRHPAVQSLQKKGVPIVLLNHLGTDGISSVSVAHSAAMTALTDHLIEEHGYRHFAYLKGTPVSYTEARLQGTLKAVEKHGLSPDSLLVLSYEDGLDAVAEIVLRNLSRLDAIIADRTDHAVQLAQILRERGVKIPQDLAIVGFDDLSIGINMDPPLTTIAFDARSMARRATELLIAIIQGEIVYAHAELPFELKVRRSCGCSV